MPYKTIKHPKISYIWVSLIVLLGVIGGCSRWYFDTHPLRLQADRPAPPLPDWQLPADWVRYTYLKLTAHRLTEAQASETDPILFTISPGESSAVIAQNLLKAGLVQDARGFEYFVRYHGLDRQIEAGEYTLHSGQSIAALALMLQEAPVKEIQVTIPEGWRAEQIAAHFQAQGLDGQGLLTLIQAGQGVDHPLLQQLHPPGQSYEGFLFPDTYRFTPDATANDILTRMLDNLAQKLPSDFKSQGQMRNYSFYQILTLASIVEREAVVAEERPLIAGVYWNRLALPQGQDLLEADPTVQYAMGYQADTGQWWKTPVRLEEYAQVDSPYNTYLYPGLPPGPIANPGIEAIMAALNPTPSNFYYFVCRNPNCVGGEHVFATTYEEHLENVKRYWGQ